MPVCRPAVRPGCARCRALKITHNNRLLRRIYKSVVPRLFSYSTMVILLSFLTLLSSLSIGMRKQLASSQHSIHGVNREINVPAVLSLSTVVLNSRDRQGMYGMQHFRAPINKPHNSL